jgi:hypothetical protein
LTGLSNATLQQRLTAVRLFFDFLIEEGQRADHPVGRGRYTPGKAFGLEGLKEIPAPSEYLAESRRKPLQTFIPVDKLLSKP